MCYPMSYKYTYDENEIHSDMEVTKYDLLRLWKNISIHNKMETA